MIKSKSHICKSQQVGNSTDLDENFPTTSKCGTCEYLSDDDSDLKMHVKEMHETSPKILDDWDSQEKMCDSCELPLKSRDKVKSHICKVIVKNPTHRVFYMKGWYDKNSCTQVYSGELNDEAAWLHSANCVLEECTPFRNITKDFEEALAESDVTHFKLEKYVEDRSILWPQLIRKLNQKQT